MEQKTLSKWLKAITIITAIVAALVFYGLVPLYGTRLAAGVPGTEQLFMPWLIFELIFSVPCFAVLVFCWKIAKNIGEDRSFTADTAKYLKKIATLVGGDTIFFLVGNLVLFFMNCNILIIMLASMVCVIAGFVITVIFSALSHLVLKASAIKKENDLTV